MDDIVLRGMAKWPNVPAVYGWLSLDRRGQWLIKGERISNPLVTEFISRNYARDERGCWFFQNGPQRVYVRLAYTPLVFHYEGDALLDHCGRQVRVAATYLDDEGSVLILGEHGIGLLDDRDLERYAEAAERLPRLARSEIGPRFGFVPHPENSLR